MKGRITPTPIIVGQGVVRRAEVGRRDNNGAGQAPFPVSHTRNLIAGATSQAIVEQSCAQRRRVCAVPLAVQVPIPTSSPCRKRIKQGLKIESLKSPNLDFGNWWLPIVPDASPPP